MEGYFSPSKAIGCTIKGNTAYISFSKPIDLMPGQGAYRAGVMAAQALPQLHFAYDVDFAEDLAKACTALCLGILATSICLHLMRV